MSALILIALILGGGTSYAAEGAVPGDSLYPIKVNVNENIKSALAFSNEAEAELQTHLLEERLIEAEELASRGELTVDTSSELRARVAQHYNEIQERSNTAETDEDFKSSAKIEASLEGMLRAHAVVLADLHARVAGNSSSALIGEVQSYADASADAQANVGVSADVEADVEATINHADTIIARTTSALANAKHKMTAEMGARAEARLADAHEAKVEAEAQLRTGAHRAAYTSAQAAIRIASEVRAMLTSLLRLEISLDEQDGFINADVETDTETETRTETNATSSDVYEIRIDAGVGTDTSVDAGVLDANIQTDTTVRSSI